MTTIGIEELNALEKRVQEATGPDRRLDGEIDVRLNDGDGEMYPAPYTASLDAALALVERALPGWGWQVVRLLGKRDHDFRVSLFDPEQPPGQGNTTAFHNTAPLALLSALIAALRAKAGA